MYQDVLTAQVNQRNLFTLILSITLLGTHIEIVLRADLVCC